MASRKELERARRREILLEAAARVFGRKPFDEATMQEVAGAAEICLQGLYEHFPSKQELYEQVMLYRAAIFRERAEQALARAEPAPLARLKALATVYVDQFQDRPFALPMFVRDRAQFDFGFDSRFSHRFQEVYQAERHRLAEILDEAARAGVLRPLDPEFLAQLCLDVLQASLHFSHRHPGPEPVEVCVSRALDCLLHGVSA
jgi:AcrR family transcriptional regulator